MWAVLLRLFAIGSAGYSLNDFFTAVGKWFGISKTQDESNGIGAGWIVAFFSIMAFLFYYVWRNQKK